MQTTLGINPEACSRSELKEWVFNTVEPTFTTQKRYLIRNVWTEQYYATHENSGSLCWVFRESDPAVDQFHTAKIARKQFPWYVWIGNWIDQCLPKFLRKQIPYRLYEIVEVDIVYEECLLHFPEFNDRVLTIRHPR